MLLNKLLVSVLLAASRVVQQDAVANEVRGHLLPAQLRVHPRARAGLHGAQPESSSGVMEDVQWTDVPDGARDGALEEALALLAQTPRRVAPRSAEIVMQLLPNSQAGGRPGGTPWLQGGARNVWSSYGGGFDVQIQTQGRPIDVDLELYDGPDNIPLRMKIHGEDGYARAIRTMVRNPTRRANSLSVRNTGNQEEPALVSVNPAEMPEAPIGPLMNIQGEKAKRSFHFEADVGSVQVYLTSEGYPINATVEMLQGPNNVKKAVDVYSDGNWPVMFTMDTPYGGVVEIVNTGPVTFPIKASIVPYSFSQFGGGPDGLVGGESFGPGERPMGAGHFGQPPRVPVPGPFGQPMRMRGEPWPPPGPPPPPPGPPPPPPLEGEPMEGEMWWRRDGVPVPGGPP